MRPQPAVQTYAAAVMFTLFAGEAIRDTVSWYGFAAWDAVVLVATGVVFWRTVRGTSPVSRRPLPGLLNRRGLARTGGRPWPLLLLAAYLAWATLSVAWSAYPGPTLLAVATILATTFAALTVVLSVGWAGVVRALSQALVAILALSILFELFVAAVIRRPILPVFPIDVKPGEKVPQAFYWSRALLFHGGQIQGILGNSNLLGFVALLALIVVGCRFAARSVGRTYGLVGIVLAVATLILTRSATVIIATLIVAVVLVLALLVRAGRRAGVWLVIAGIAMVGVLAALNYGALLAVAGKSEDLTGRLDIWRIAGTLFLERPVFGWGWTSYWQPWIPMFAHLAARNGVVYLQAHNAFLDVAFQLGAIGLLIFVGLIVATATSLYRRGIPDAGSARAASSSPAESDWVIGKLLPGLLLAALVAQALAESRLLVEGNWALLCALALTTGGARLAPPNRGLDEGRSRIASRGNRNRPPL